MADQNALQENIVCVSPGARDFDFLIGRWVVHNRKLRDRLSGSNSWDEFEATLQVRSILDGLGNVDEFKATLEGKDLAGVTLRLFNPETKQWSLYWVDNWTCVLQPPLAGRFQNGRAEFYSMDDFRGKKILVRFVWSDITSESAKWDQAFSEDNGLTWETNWTMEFRRLINLEKISIRPQPADL